MVPNSREEGKSGEEWYFGVFSKLYVKLLFRFKCHKFGSSYSSFYGSAYLEILSKTTKSQTIPCSLPRSLIL